MWTVKTILVNPDTELRKVTAICDGRTFFVKARMKTPEERKAVWDEIYRQHKEKPKVDVVAEEGKTDLEAREVP